MVYLRTAILIPLLLAACAVNNPARERLQTGIRAAGLGFNSEAESAIREALAIQPDMAEAHFHLGNVYLRGMRFGRAKSEFERTLELDPDYSPAHLNLGMIFGLEGNREQEKQHYLQAQALGNRSATTLLESFNFETGDSANSSGSSGPLDPQAEADVLGTVESWLAAWESQDVEAYLASYHADFTTGSQLSHAEWRANRRRNIENKTSIALSISEYDLISISDTVAQLIFWLEYTSPEYSDRTRKQLDLQATNGQWQIIAESNLEIELP